MKRNQMMKEMSITGTKPLSKSDVQEENDFEFEKDDEFEEEFDFEEHCKP